MRVGHGSVRYASVPSRTSFCLLTELQPAIPFDGGFFQGFEFAPQTAKLRRRLTVPLDEEKCRPEEDDAYTSGYGITCRLAVLDASEF